MNRDKYISIDHLLDQPEFIEWVKEGKNDAYWQNFILNNPQHQTEIELAESILLGIVTTPYTPAAQRSKNAIWDDLEKEIHQDKRSSKIKRMTILSLCASVAIGILWLSATMMGEGFSGEEEFSTQEKWIEYTNHSQDNWPIALADGSQIILEPNAYLKYPLVFQQKTRKVQLKGDAFFEIAHDSLKPFYVYANEAVIRVLGTSFHVKAKENDEDIEVIVRTGKVAVYKGKEIKEYQAKRIKHIEPILVTPNQIATLNKSKLTFNKRLVARPILSKPLDVLETKHFNNKSIHDICEALTEVYGIDIEISDQISTQCRLTTTLSDQPLFEKLKILCDPLGLTYYEENVAIHIVGHCN